MHRRRAGVILKLRDDPSTVYPAEKDPLRTAFKNVHVVYNEERSMIHTFAYVKSFLRDKDVASITPTSNFCVKRVCKRINFDQSNLIVEYGPGTGVFSNYILEKMSADSRLILIERNNDFNRILKKTIRDPRVVIVNDSAENVLETLRACKETQADYILSGIPFFWLSADVKKRILVNTRRALKNGGKFLVYQTCFQTDNHLKVHLERFFPMVRTKFEVRNIPPMRLFEATKGETANLSVVHP